MDIIIDSILKIGSLGGLFSLFYVMIKDIHKWRYSPKLKILSIDPQGDQIRLLVKNYGRNGAAINAVGKVTIRTIEKGDILGTKKEIDKIRENRKPDAKWKETDDAYLRAEEWETGIEDEHLIWSTMPCSKSITINPKTDQRLQFVFSDGPYVKIASEDLYKCRARLRLDKYKKYYGYAYISAENAKPSDHFKFEIYLGNNHKAKIKRYMGDIPERPKIET